MSELTYDKLKAAMDCFMEAEHRESGPFIMATFLGYLKGQLVNGEYRFYEGSRAKLEAWSTRKDGV